MTIIKIRKTLIIGISLIAVIAILFVDTIPQDLLYHGFIDGHMFYGITNFWNVKRAFFSGWCDGVNKIK